MNDNKATEITYAQRLAVAIRNEVDARELTIKQLSKMTGIRRGRLRRVWYTGAYYLDEVAAIAVALNLKPTDLLLAK